MYKPHSTSPPLTETTSYTHHTYPILTMHNYKDHDLSTNIPKPTNKADALSGKANELGQRQTLNVRVHTN